MGLNLTINEFDLSLDDLLLQNEEDGFFESALQTLSSLEAIRTEIANEANLKRPAWAKLLALAVLGGMRDDA
jgi:hypothetical protein